MSYKHQSGSEKRKKTKVRENETEKQSDAMLIFLQTAATAADKKKASGSTSNELEDVNPLLIDILSSTNSDLSSIEGEKAIDSEEKTHTEYSAEIDNINKAFTSQDDELMSFSREIRDRELDIADWPMNISSDFEEHFIKNRPEQNIDKISGCSKQLDGKKTRLVQSSVFYKIKENGEKVFREWLVYSCKSGSVYCYVCKLVSKKIISNLSANGYNNWKNITQALKSHEQSYEHIASIGTLVSRSNIEGRIDTEMRGSYQKEKEYCRNMPLRVVAAIKFLSKNGLAFYGSTTKLFTKGNGNVLSSLEFLSEFDPFLAGHLQKYGNSGSGHVSYLSTAICSEFINLLAKEVTNFMTKELETAKYFAIIVDSTPNVSHIDQLTLIIRYVLPNGQPVERFLGFLPIFSHTAESLSHALQNKLEDLMIDINYCRGQSYDNAVNMSGKYNGLQAKIKEKSKSAHFVPCSSHSLNSVGNSAAESYSEAAKYFENVQCLYNFFSASTHRWNVLQKCLEMLNPKPPMVKKLCDTRWSARADAIKSIALGFNEIKLALKELNEDPHQKQLTKTEAEDLLRKTETLEFNLMTVIWKRILDRINATSKSLQNTEANLTAACTLYNSLIEFIKDFREKFAKLEEEAKQIQPHALYKDETSRVRKREQFFDDGPAQHIILNSSGNFKINAFFPICDKLITELKLRMKLYDSVNEVFGVIFNEPSSESFNISVKNIEHFYNMDVNVRDNLVDELIQFKELCKSNNISLDPQKMLKFLIDTNILSTFSNVEILLRLYLTIPISNASGERSFSTLKRVKSYLRNSLNEENLASLAVLNVQSDILDKLNIDEIINKFSEIKVRKKIWTIAYLVINNFIKS